MKVPINRQWCMEMALREGDAEMGAGLVETLFEHGRSPLVAPEAEEPPAPSGFGRLVNLLRRKRRVTLEGVAGEVGVELADLMALEQDPHHIPHLRTAYLLADFFGLPLARVLQLAGLSESGESNMEAAVPFAASADPSAELSQEERAVLDAFVKVLNEER